MAEPIDGRHAALLAYAEQIKEDADAAEAAAADYKERTENAPVRGADNEAAVLEQAGEESIADLSDEQISDAAEEIEEAEEAEAAEEEVVEDEE